MLIHIDLFEILLHLQASHTHTHTGYASHFLFALRSISWACPAVLYITERLTPEVNWLLTWFSRWETHAQDWRVGEKEKPEYFFPTLLCCKTATMSAWLPFLLVPACVHQHLCCDDITGSRYPSAKGW